MALIILFLEMIALVLDTFRIQFVTHGQKKKSFITGFFELIIIVVAISRVLSHLDNLLNVIGYAAGYATGGAIGIWLEERLSIGHIHMRIVSPNYGMAITSLLRSNGFAVTETMGRGKKGVVSVLHCSLNREDVPLVRELVIEVDSCAFIVANEVRSIQHGFWHVSAKKQMLNRPGMKEK